MLQLVAGLAQAEELTLAGLRVKERQRKIRARVKVLDMVDKHGAAVFAMCLAQLALMPVVGKHPFPAFMPCRPPVELVATACAYKPLKAGELRLSYCHDGSPPVRAALSPAPGSGEKKKDHNDDNALALLISRGPKDS